MDKFEALKKYFGYSVFREGQGEIIDNIISGRDTLSVMPTGAGKSICYQIPAVLSKGVTVVISPLISLMKDQVSSLNQNGIRAAYINSSLTYKQYLKVLDLAAEYEYKIIYVAPERLSVDSFLEVFSRMEISIVAVDEAHCVSQWGQDFRPSYLRIAEFIENLPIRPTVCAFTATATDKVKTDISEYLRLNNPFEITTGFDRPNLYFGVKRISSQKEKDYEVLNIVSGRENKSGIIYCATRKNVEAVHQLLVDNGYPATRYHAGLSDNERRDNQDDFVYDRKPIIVATNAFGMGIDKSNVSYVIHYNMPMNIESYYQEAGRAGRDGEKAECILLYSPRDVHLNEFLIDNSESNDELTEEMREELRKKDRELLKRMTYYATGTSCLRSFILEYFGEKRIHHCQNCSVCLGNSRRENMTEEAKTVIECVTQTGERFGITTVAQFLHGDRNDKLLSYGYDDYDFYGSLSCMSLKDIRFLIDYLIGEEYLEISNGLYPILQIMPRANDIMFGSDVILVDFPAKEKKEHTKAMPKPKARETVENPGLLDELKKLRRDLSVKMSVPAYVVFSDSVLREMSTVMPQTSEEFLSISGIGQRKLALYGEVFMSVIRDFKNKKAPDKIGSLCETEKSEVDFDIGDTVFHTLFGKGTVTGIEPSENHIFLCIEFDNFGEKKLCYGIAPLEKM